jgi:acetolactate synthase-1/2/3 large subunit
MTLKEYGVKHVFGLPGDTSMVWYDALRQEREHITHVLTRDERSAGFMADTYARLSGKPGICEAPSGGGATYLLPGIAEANYSFIPLLAFTTDTPLHSEERGVLTEIDQVKLYAPVTKWSTKVKQASLMPEIARKAFRVATGGRPGAVHLSLPEDILAADIGKAQVYAEPKSAVCPAHRTRPDPDDVREVANLLRAAQRPMLIAGGGVVTSGAFNSLQELAELLSAPVATTITGKGSIAETHPLSVGVVGGNGGRPYAHELLKQADLLFYIGTNLDSVATMAWTLPPLTTDKSIIQLDVEPSQVGQQYRLAASLVADATLGLADLVTEVRRTIGSSGRSGIVEELAKLREAWLYEADRRVEANGTLPAHPLRVIRAVQKALSQLGQEAVVLADPGTSTPFTAAYYELSQAGRQVVIPRAFGGLGYVIPAVVGAAYARPSAKIIGLCTDGGFGMAAGELETIHRLGQNILLINFHNNSFGWIKMLQHLYHEKSYYSVDFSGDSNYSAIAGSFGLNTIEVEDVRDIETAIRQGIEAKTPTFIDVRTLPPIDETPPVAKWEQDTIKISL